MLSRPDIAVGRPESSELLLAVEVKSIAAQDSADGLKEYMVRQNCPAGMLVTPETILFLTNRYTEFQPSSIEQTGTCATSELLGQTVGRRQTEPDMVERVCGSTLWLPRRGGRGQRTHENPSRRWSSGGPERRSALDGKAAAARQLNRCVTYLWKATGSTPIPLRHTTSARTPSTFSPARRKAKFDCMFLRFA